MGQVQKLFDNNILVYVMSGLCIAGLLLKFILFIVYKRLVKASDNMANTKNKLMKLVKIKFEACYKLKIGVNNVDIFVDKYIYKNKFCGIPLYTWENIGGQILALCLMIGVGGAGLAYYYDCGRIAILSTFSVGALASVLLIMLESLLDLPVKKNMVRINMQDYLENMFKVRLEQEYFYPEKLEAYRNEYFDAQEKKTDSGEELHLGETAAAKEEDKHAAMSKTEEKDTAKKKEKKKTAKVYEINREEEAVIADILKEFMA